MSRTFATVFAIALLAGMMFATVPVSGQASAVYLLNVPTTVAVGEEFEVAVSSVNWGDSLESLERDPCYGSGVDLDRTPTINQPRDSDSKNR